MAATKKETVCWTCTNSMPTFSLTFSPDYVCRKVELLLANLNIMKSNLRMFEILFGIHRLGLLGCIPSQGVKSNSTQCLHPSSNAAGVEVEQQLKNQPDAKPKEQQQVNGVTVKGSEHQRIIRRQQVGPADEMKSFKVSIGKAVENDGTWIWLQKLQIYLTVG